METVRFSKGVRSVVRLEADASGKLSPVVMYSAETRRKKSKGVLGLVDRTVRRVATAQAAMADSYLERHQKSSARRRDAWLSDMPVNLIRAHQKGMKKLRVLRFISM